MERKNYRNVWLAACFSNVETPAESIHAKFKGGHEADYTMRIFDSLVTDPSVTEIYSNETGELYFYIDEDGNEKIIHRREQATMNKADIQRIIDGYSAKAHELRQTAKAEEAKADELKKERNNRINNLNLRELKAKTNAELDFKAYIENSRAEEAKHRDEARTLYRIVKVVEECEVNATAAAVLEAIKADPKKYGKPLHYKRTKEALKNVLPEGVKIWESGRGSAQIGIDFISYDTTLVYDWTPEAIENATAPDTMEPEEIEAFTRKAIKARADIIAEYEAMETALNKKKEEFTNLWALNEIFPSIPFLKVTYI